MSSTKYLCSVCTKFRSPYVRFTKVAGKGWPYEQARPAPELVDEYLPVKPSSTKKIFGDKFTRPVPIKAYIHDNDPELKQCDELYQFFDSPSNWGVGKVAFGYPWTMSLLRGKSNSDLHKLWFVLWKERNMLLTLDRECELSNKTTPGEKRLEIVEESMENILQLVKERNREYNLLEHGEMHAMEGAYYWNIFGFRYFKWFQEHDKPWWDNVKFKFKRQPYRHYVIPWIRLRLEMKREYGYERQREIYQDRLKSKRMFPDVPLPPGYLDKPKNPYAGKKFNLSDYMARVSREKMNDK